MSFTFSENMSGINGQTLNSINFHLQVDGFVLQRQNVPSSPNIY